MDVDVDVDVDVVGGVVEVDVDVDVDVVGGAVGTEQLRVYMASHFIGQGVSLAATCFR